MQEESERIEKLSREEITLIANEALQKLRNHPNIPVRTGDYARGFFLKKKSSGTYFGYKLKNKKYRITHLLEHGHAKRGGGRTRAFPHWKDAQKIVDELPDRLKRRISGGT